MTLAELKKQLEYIKEKKSELCDEEEIINSQIEAFALMDIVNVLPGTSWRISRDGDCLEYMSLSFGGKDDKFEKKIYDEYGLYPHGSKHITNDLIVGCSDHTIYIRALLCGKTAKKNSRQEDFNRVSAKVLIDFAKENNMKISCVEAERKLQDAKENVAFLEKQLKMINELIKETE
jgi:hypothetical protein